MVCMGIAIHHQCVTSVQSMSNCPLSHSLVIDEGNTVCMTLLLPAQTVG